MPRKKKAQPEEAKIEVESAEQTEETVEPAVSSMPESTQQFSVKPILQMPKTKTDSDMVKVKVLVGTLLWEGGSFEKGSTFEVSKERMKLFDPRDIKVVG